MVSICLYGVLGVAHAELPADDHGLEDSPAVPANDTPAALGDVHLQAALLPAAAAR
ncbi:hypothetical protein IscW_ISCW011632 [Ixodes scapularis]|uniref:Uncharacterized protein n=1 Tax=Ixodes scapularis TaxID=6945 RepID=B7Q744_IXOSC|nr:hypothetical protein IscW_ISCW011632 [Ixodes scapularis]|eukprot:XP_002412095.1 hypothetical protein IscW_ISCW011632 [Ixodes scapularis]